MCNAVIFIFHKLNDITTITYKIVKQSIWPWLLTLIWPWPWDWPLTLTIWRKQIVSKFVIYLKLRDVKTWHHTSNRRRHSECAILQGTFSNQLEVSIFIFHKLNDITTMTYKIVKQIIWPWLLTLIWPWDSSLTLTITWRKTLRRISI